MTPVPSWPSAEAEANLVIRKADYLRDKRLFEQNLVPRSQYESTEAAFHASEANVASTPNRIRQSEAGLAEARDQLQRCRITSPMPATRSALSTQ